MECSAASVSPAFLASSKTSAAAEFAPTTSVTADIWAAFSLRKVKYSFAIETRQARNTKRLAGSIAARISFRPKDIREPITAASPASAVANLRAGRRFGQHPAGFQNVRGCLQYKN